MIDAFVHGKLSREQENMEDMLTSCVFGLLKHAPISLSRFIARASLVDGTMPLRHLENARMRRLQFWPWLEGGGFHPCEPDVRVDFETCDGVRVVFVEAKYLSGKSSFALDAPATPAIELHAANDQLAREWQNLELLDPQGWLIYLTADYCVPRAELQESDRDLGHKPGRICWLSWRELRQVDPGPGEDGLLHDVHRLLERLDLLPFLGIRMARAHVVDWRFERRPWNLGFPGFVAPAWRFREPPAKPWFRSPSSVVLSWRFSR